MASNSEVLSSPQTSEHERESSTDGELENPDLTELAELDDDEEEDDEDQTDSEEDDEDGSSSEEEREAAARMVEQAHAINKMGKDAPWPGVVTKPAKVDKAYQVLTTAVKVPAQVPAPRLTLSVVGALPPTLPPAAVLPTVAPRLVLVQGALPPVQAILPPVQAPVFSRAAPTAAEVEEIVRLLPGITISGSGRVTGSVPANIDDILQRESDETETDFATRKTLSHKLASLTGYPLNKATAVTIAALMMKKARLGLTYEPNVENALLYLNTHLLAAAR